MQKCAVKASARPLAIQVTKQVGKIPLLVMYYLTKFDDIICKEIFELF